MRYYNILKFCVGILSLMLSWELMSVVAETKAFKFFLKMLDKIVHLITTAMGLTAGRYQDYIDIMNTYRREKSWIYKYHYTMNVSIESLGLRNKTNVQTVSFYITIASILISMVITAGIGMFLFVVLTITLIVFLHLILVFMSRSVTIKRSIALMDAEDILCTSMEDGIQVAIDRNVGAIDPVVRYMFEELQTDINIKTPMGTALDSLNTKAGPQFDSFCQTALNHYRDDDPVALMTFADNIKRNSKRRIAISQQQANYKMCLKYYAASMASAAIFTVVMIGILGSGTQYFFTNHGRMFTIISLCFALLGFIASQIIFSGGVD